MSNRATDVSIRPALYRKLKRFADRKNVNFTFLLNTVLQEFLDTWDKKFSTEERQRWHDQADKLDWPPCRQGDTITSLVSLVEEKSLNAVKTP